MARRDSPFSRACWIAFHRANWVGVGVRPRGFDAWLAVSFSAASFPRNSSELRGSEQLTAGSDGVESLCSPGAED